MTIKNTVTITFVLALLSSGVALADQDVKERILAGLEENLPDLTIEADQLSPSPVDGLWLLRVGTEVIYIDEAGEHLFQGNLIHLPSRENLTEGSRAEARRLAFAEAEEDRRLTYEAEDERYAITVFTDIDCGYCRQLHRDMPQLNEAGITVHYLFYPRSGPGSDAWEKSDRVWCAENRHEAMNDAKSGGQPEAAICEDTPTRAHYALGRQMQVSGTPATFTQSGHLIRGYKPPSELVSNIESLEGRD